MSNKSKIIPFRSMNNPNIRKSPKRPKLNSSCLSSPFNPPPPAKSHPLLFFLSVSSVQPVHDLSGHPVGVTETAAPGDHRSEFVDRERIYSGVRSKTPPEGYSVFVCYESSMCKTAIEHPRVPFSNASLHLSKVEISVIFVLFR